MKTYNLSAAMPPWATALIVIGALAAIGILLFIFFKTRKTASKVEAPAIQPAEPDKVQPVEEQTPVIDEDPITELATEQPISQQSVSIPPVEKPEERIKEQEGEDDGEDEASVKRVVRDGEHIKYIIIKYKKSFTAKLIQSDDEVKSYYSSLKNELLSYDGVKSRISWKYETFYQGRVTLAKIAMRGKCPCLFLALKTAEITDEKYIVEDMSEVAAYEKTPCLYRIKNDRRLKYSNDLIASVMGERVKNEDYKEEDWASKYPYENIEPLIERGLVKVLTEEDAQSGDVFKPRDYVQASEVDELMQDDVAVALIEESDEISDKTKSGIINIDTLSKYFSDGETVTLEEIKKRISEVPKKTTCIKVLARGVLDKKLTVIADSFSMEAAKMILLTGGYVVKKKSV